MLLDADSLREDKGLSTRHLILIFLAGVAVCGVFFSLGFLVGYNERSTRMLPDTERVSNPAAIPPTINPPLETVQVGPGNAAAPTTSVPPPVATPQANSSAAPPSEQKPGPVPATAPPVTSPPPSRAQGEREPDLGRAASPPAVGEVGGGFTVQVVATGTKGDAETLVRILKGRGYPVFLVAPQQAHANDNLYRVQVGPYTSRDSAEKARAKLIGEGFKPFIRH